MHAAGRLTPAVELEVDLDQPDRSLSAGPAGQHSEPLLDRMATAGIWADRTTTIDLVAQLQQAVKRPIEMVVLNLLEADGAPLNAGLLVSGASDVVSGAAALAKELKARLHIVGAADVLALIATEVRRFRDSVTVRLVDLPNDYPQADPTILVYMLTGRRLRPGRLPTEHSIVMLDGAAALAIGRVVSANEPMTEVPLAVRERGRGGRVHLVTAAIGTPLSFVLDQLNIPATDLIVRIGPVLRDVRVPLETVISGGELRLDVGPSQPPGIPDPCIRCGWCVAACPTRIHPAGLLEAAQQSDPDLARDYGLEACIECGICSYVCPSRLPLLGAIRQLKAVHS
jgi:electron transport complex protein RnfC